MKTSKHLITGIVSMFFFAGLATTITSEAANDAVKKFQPLTQQGLTVPKQEPRKPMTVQAPPRCPQGFTVKKMYGKQGYRGYLCKPVIPKKIKCPPNQPFFSDGCSYGCIAPLL